MDSGTSKTSVEFPTAEEKILIRAYHTSEALKEAIRKSVTNYSKTGWKPINILRDGPFIRVLYKEREHEG